MSSDRASGGEVGPLGGFLIENRGRSRYNGRLWFGPRCPEGGLTKSIMQENDP